MPCSSLARVRGSEPRGCRFDSGRGNMEGTAQGGVQALSRTIYASLSPKQKSGEFFGLYGLCDRKLVKVRPGERTIGYQGEDFIFDVLA